MPIEDYSAAAQRIASLLKTLTAPGRLRLKYRITAGAGAADPDQLEAREIYVELAGPDAGLLTDIAAAVLALRGAGAGRVALLGASQGGSEALIAAGGRASGTGAVAGVAALSADELDQPLAPPPGPRTAVTAAATVRVPALLAVAPADPYVSLTGTRSLFAALGTPAARKRLLVQPAGAGHGWVMVDGTPGEPEPPLAAQLAAFLRTVTT